MTEEYRVDPIMPLVRARDRGITEAVIAGKRVIIAEGEPLPRGLITGGQVARGGPYVIEPASLRHREGLRANLAYKDALGGG